MSVLHADWQGSLETSLWGGQTLLYSMARCVGVGGRCVCVCVCVCVCGGMEVRDTGREREREAGNDNLSYPHKLLSIRGVASGRLRVVLC